MVGGPEPYWQSWSFNAAGNRATQTDHDTTGQTTGDTTTSYTYPTQGSAADQPDTLASTSATGPDASTQTGSYAYDAAGNTTSVIGGAHGDQTLTWNSLDQLATDTTGAGQTSYVYDADGNLAVRRDPGTTTLFIGDEQLTLNTTTGAVTGSRYYSINDTTVAVRTSASTWYELIPDRQGTDQLAINDNGQAVTRRQYKPFGEARGVTPGAWPGDNGYVAGTPDATTGLDNLGARQYDPTTGRFLSPDPLLEAGDPTQLGGYDYAGNNPTTHSDPSGLEILNEGGGGGGDYIDKSGDDFGRDDSDERSRDDAGERAGEDPPESWEAEQGRYYDSATEDFKERQLWENDPSNQTSEHGGGDTRKPRYPTSDDGAHADTGSESTDTYDARAAEHAQEVREAQELNEHLSDLDANDANEASAEDGQQPGTEADSPPASNPRQARDSNGRFKTNPEKVNGANRYGRVKLRADTKGKIQAKAPKDSSGNYIDPNTGQSVPKTGPFHYGHKPGYEFWRNREMAESDNWTRDEFIEYENDPEHYQIEDPANNMSHKYEQP
ncbi:hypothetical protein Athai_38820 [Actinocatenispora thailandica]|uniref:Bacterial toxin 24 domain-containing protein n=2 Tax=Actinocatenispora thailandica TaxID=227318 RepID=A0A7R7HYM0_9ACTN|nr:GH-E family nuclease [Actinocatenispora thailandica]BCJ36379.1 hypothetical protein Athai_38820 [Actinocatenispora thailandica]